MPPLAATKVDFLLARARASAGTTAPTVRQRLAGNLNLSANSSQRLSAQHRHVSPPHSNAKAKAAAARA